ncbi:MAG: phospholipase [Moraxellaceae bacterium]|nr:MAG: phospholipase [Moraxellaceae bacterium]
MTIEALNRSNRFALTPNKRNYLKPVSYSDSPNTAPYRAAIADNDSEVEPAFTDLKHTEAELQLSVKILIRENIFEDNGHLYLGYTNHALWQVYNRKISAPFRESDHQPELILSFTNDWEIFGFRNVLNEAVLNHQSNGQSGLLSRSWNRVMFNSVFEKDDFVFAFNPWYRLPEKEARYRGDPKGDDNPDITHYMGNFQLTGAYKYKSDIFSVEVRNNLKSDNRGAIELGWTFPVSATMRGYVNYFDGYGHSLIDYNVKQQVLGLGIIFTDLF